MNFRTSSPFVLLLGALLIPTYSPLVASAVPQPLIQLPQEKSVAPSLEEAERWLFTYFGLEQSWMTLQKELQWIITRDLTDMIIGTFIAEKPVREHRFLRHVGGDVSDRDVNAVTISHDKEGAAPSYLCFCTESRCKILNLQVPQGDPRELTVVMKLPEEKAFFKAVYNYDNTKLLVVTQVSSFLMGTPQTGPMDLYEIALDGSTALSTTKLLCPRENQHDKGQWQGVLDVGYINNGNLIVATWQKEVYVIDSEGNCLSYWKEPFDKNFFASSAKIGLQNRFVFFYIGEEHLPKSPISDAFKLIRYTLASNSSITLVDAIDEVRLCGHHLTISKNGIIALNDWRSHRYSGAKKVLLLNATTGEPQARILALEDNQRQELSENGRLLLFSPGSEDSDGNWLLPATAAKAFVVHCKTNRPLIILERTAQSCGTALAQFNNYNNYIITAHESTFWAHLEVCVWKINPLIFTLDQEEFFERVSLKNALKILVMRSYKRSPVQLAEFAHLSTETLRNYLAALYCSLEESLKTYVLMILRKDNKK